MFNFKRIIALGVVTTMVFGSTVTSFAANDANQTTETAVTAAGTGTNENSELASKHVYSADLPTAAYITQVATYTVDIEGWAKETGGSRYGLSDPNAVDDTYGVMFKNYDDTTLKGLSNVSDALTVTNKSSDPIDITVEVSTTTAASGLATLATKPDFSGTGESGATGKNIYLGVYSQGDDEIALTATASGAEGVKLTGVGATAYDKYEAKWDATASKYTFTVKTDASGFPTNKFYLYGKANFDAPLYTVSGNTKTALTVPAITVKITPALNSNATGYAMWEGTDLWFAATEEGGLPAAKAISNVLVDGKTVTLATATTSAAGSATEGWAKVTWAEICTAYGIDKDKTTFNPTHIQFTVDGKTYIAPIK